MPRDGYLVTGNDDDSLTLVSGLGRQAKNHPEPKEASPGMVSECFTTYCDKAMLSCVRTDESGASMLLTCCNAQNPETLCNDPPCWFRGQACPHRASPRVRRLDSPSKEQSDETEALV